MTRKTTICEYSSRCSVEGCDFFLSYSFLGQWAYYQSFHYASVGAGTVYYDSATNLVEYIAYSFEMESRIISS
ncbi:hypothetical protein OIU79_011833 [Salix purpurea]|uniref:Uncharacterized protein n=1 Tax=Salix purpurea TaxID=77065 RepID=A0A9Q0Q2C5_SALPP|nr:hypothetical protein OIU79_011833 [Salix purpurea]